jgi:ribosomal subunit interface protein
MNIQFRQGSGHISERVLQRAEGKISKLSKLVTERNYEAQVHVDIEKESGSHNSESLWRSSVNLMLAGDRFNASEVGSTPEKAIDLATKELKREIRRAKTKAESVRKRNGSLLKRFWSTAS